MTHDMPLWRHPKLRTNPGSQSHGFTHNALLKTNGLYARLHELQFNRGVVALGESPTSGGSLVPDENPVR